MQATVDKINILGHQPEEIRHVFGSAFSNGRHRFFAVMQGDQIRIEFIASFDKDTPKMTGHEKLEAAQSIERAIRLFLAEPVVTEKQILSAGDWKSRPCPGRDSVSYLESSKLGLRFFYERETKDLRSVFGTYIKRGSIIEEILGRSDADKRLWRQLQAAV
jgi:hypothetical protein